MKRSTVHPIPWGCRIFGHKWFNTHSRNTQLGTDRCLRKGCPGDGHVWEHDHVDENDLAHDKCIYPGCDTTSTWQVPDMVSPLDVPPPPHRTPPLPNPVVTGDRWP